MGSRIAGLAGSLPSASMAPSSTSPSVEAAMAMRALRLSALGSASRPGSVQEPSVTGREVSALQEGSTASGMSTTSPMPSLPESNTHLRCSTNASLQAPRRLGAFPHKRVLSLCRFAAKEAARFSRSPAPRSSRARGDKAARLWRVSRSPDIQRQGHWAHGVAGPPVRPLPATE